MRLINTLTHEFDEFEGQDVPDYAILSHRWGKGEVLFKDVVNETAQRKPGYQKIVQCCSEAQKRGFSYVWIDTCCIDRSSSAELSEAINSMFRWYQNAEVCLVHLCDVQCSIEDAQAFQYAFKNSVWFTRGWTLQELIAPRSIEFFDSEWIHVGSLDGFQDDIAQITSIPREILTHQWPLHKLPIAQRMSWAAARQTTRLEDRAYSLMGIFGINMPMLYGEGENAFRRLQEEIVKRSNDTSILFWNGEPLTLFASSPSAFNVLPKYDFQSFSEAMHAWDRKWNPLINDGSSGLESLVTGSSTMTNQGLSLSIPLFPWYFNMYLGLVAALDHFSLSPLYCFIYLCRTTYGARLFRTSWNGETIKSVSRGGFNALYRSYHFHDFSARVKNVVIASEAHPMQLPNEYEDHTPGTVVISFEESTVWGSSGVPQISDVITRSTWDPKHPSLRPMAPCEILAILQVTKLSGQKGYLFIGYDEDFHLCLVLGDWAWPYHTYGTFDSINTSDIDHQILPDLLQPYTFLTWCKNRDLQKKELTIRANRKPASSSAHQFLDLGMWVHVSCSAVESYEVTFRKMKP